MKAKTSTQGANRVTRPREATSRTVLPEGSDDAPDRTASPTPDFTSELMDTIADQVQTIAGLRTKVANLESSHRFCLDRLQAFESRDTERERDASGHRIVLQSLDRTEQRLRAELRRMADALDEAGTDLDANRAQGTRELGRWRVAALALARREQALARKLNPLACDVDDGVNDRVDQLKRLRER